MIVFTSERPDLAAAAATGTAEAVHITTGQTGDNLTPAADFVVGLVVDERSAGNAQVNRSTSQWPGPHLVRADAEVIVMVVSSTIAAGIFRIITLTIIVGIALMLVSCPASPPTVVTMSGPSQLRPLDVLSVLQGVFR